MILTDFDPPACMSCGRLAALAAWPWCSRCTEAGTLVVAKPQPERELEPAS